MNNLKLYKELEEEIQKSYESSITMQEAEKLAAKFLYAQMQVANELKNVDLDSRMRKSGVKAVRSAIYMKLATATDKKPSDVMLQSQVDLDEIVQKEQDELNKAEVEKELLERYLSIFKDSHVYYRQISKGSYE